jgi:hypothetical protein
MAPILAGVYGKEVTTYHKENSNESHHQLHFDP